MKFVTENFVTSGFLIFGSLWKESSNQFVASGFDEIPSTKQVDPENEENHFYKLNGPGGHIFYSMVALWIGEHRVGNWSNGRKSMGSLKIAIRSEILIQNVDLPSTAQTKKNKLRYFHIKRFIFWYGDHSTNRCSNTELQAHRTFPVT